GLYRSARVFVNSSVDVTEESCLVVRQDIAKASENWTLTEVAAGKMRFSQDHEGRSAIQVDDAIVTEYSPFRLSYTGDKALGTATATITATYDNESYFGSATKEYEIVPGKADFSSEDDFVTLHDSGLYDEFVGASGVRLTSDVVIGERESLYLNGATFAGTFTNYGKVESVSGKNAPSYTFSDGFVNFGAIDLGEKSTVNFGSVTNNGSAANADATLSFGYGYVQQDAVLNNYASVTVLHSFNVGSHDRTATFNNFSTGTVVPTEDSAVPLSLYGAINNAGNLTGFVTNIYEGTFTNLSGGIASFTKTDVFADGAIDNNSGAELILNGTTHFKNIDLNNAGTLVNKSVMDVDDSFVRFDNEGTFNNAEGYVWGYDAIADKIDENVTIKKRLNESVVLLNGVEDLSFVYDETPHLPSSFTVDDATLSEGSYRVSYEYVSGIKTSNNVYDPTFSYVGTIRYTVTVTDPHIDYGGSADVDYTISYGSKVVTGTDFLSTVNNDNYDTIRLSGHIVHYGSGLVISEHQTLITDGYNLTLQPLRYQDTIVKNYGKIVVSETDEEEIGSYALEVNGYSGSTREARIDNYGVIENHATIYIGENHGGFRNMGKGSVTGDGVIYTYFNGVIGTTTCTVYDRGLMTGESVELDVETYDYDGTEKTPFVSVNKNGVRQQLTDYDIEYVNNVDAGTASVIISAHKDCPTHVGATIKTFTINRVENFIDKPVGMSYIRSSELPAFDGKNYYKYTLRTDVVMDSHLTLPDDVIIDAGTFRFKQNDSSYTVTFGKGTKLHVGVDSFDDLQTYLYIADKVTLTADIADDTELEFSPKNENYDPSTFFIGEDPFHAELDLAGHSVAGKLIYYTNFDKATTLDVYSTGTKGSVASVSIIPADSGGKGQMTLSLKNLSTGMLSMRELPGPLKITAEDCDVVNENTQRGSTALYIYGWGNTTAEFTNCSFSAKSGVSLYGGDITFSDCSFNATATYGAGYYGSAIYLSRGGRKSKVFNVTISGGSITSQYGYGIEQTTTDEVTIEVTDVTFHTALGDAYGADLD
ncbi:MAG: hypothetical protein IJ735_05405, partial [Clostridia bacterium]|nr:hypothetical protein [Clostridia bacterium]